MMKTKLLLLATILACSLSATAQHYVGGDISMLPYYEAAGCTYYDTDGTTLVTTNHTDLIAYLKAQGWNSMRVRLFVDPVAYKETNNDTYWNEGARQTLDDVKALGKRIKDAGLKFMLDIHYSDTWTDPDKHLAPQSWNSSNYATEVYNYTKDVLQTLVADGATPDFIQVGNELNNGMLWDNLWANDATNKCYANSTGTVMTNFISYIKNGCKACREVCPTAKIIFHVAMDYNDDRNWAAKTWPATLASNSVDYDIIGLSYYPYYHGTLSDLTTLLSYLQSNYPTKEVQLVEVGYPHAYYPDGSSYNYTSTYPATEDGQKSFTTDLITTLSVYSNVTGLYWWFPEANEKGNNGTQVTTSWYNMGLWDNNTGEAMEALSVLKNFTTQGVKVGATDNSTGWMGAKSNIHTVADGGAIHYTFTQTRNTGDNNYGFLLYAGTAGANPSWDNATIILKGCSYEEKDKNNTNCTNNFNWDTFSTDMNGATVDMYVTYINGTLTMTSTITTTGNTQYNYSYSKTLSGAPKALDICLSVDNACLTITNDDYEPPYTYLNDFETISGTTAVHASGNATIQGSGTFDATTFASTAYGTVFQNASGGKRTNYLLLPSDALSHSVYTKQLTIGFWVNKSSASNYFYSPIFSAYGSAPSESNTWPMLVCESRGLIQENCSGYCDFGINDNPPGTAYNDGTPTVSTAWLDDNAWHYYTLTLTPTTAKVYVDGTIQNSWTVDGTSDGQVISGLFTNGSDLKYICLGGNQAWNWNDNDPAFAFDDVMITNKALSGTEIASIISSKKTAVDDHKVTIITNKGDITSMINSDFETNANGWSGYGNYWKDQTWTTRSWRGANQNAFIERSTSGTITCTLSDMPAGKYKVVAAARAYAGGIIQPEIAGSTGTAETSLTGVGDLANEGNMEINTNGVEMPYSSLGGFTTDASGHNWRWISASGTLTSDGSLVINFNCTGTGWMAIDDVHLYCTSLGTMNYTTSMGTLTGTTLVSTLNETNKDRSVVTCDIITTNPNAIIRTNSQVKTATGEALNNNMYSSSRISKLVLYDGYAFSYYGDVNTSNFIGYDNGAVLYRNFPANTWCTLVVPFYPSGLDYMLQPSALNQGVLSFANAPASGLNDEPLLVKSTAGTTSITGSRTSTVSPYCGDMTSGLGVPMTGVYNIGGTVPTSTESTYYYVVGSDNKLHKVTGNGVNISPFRAYFALTDVSLARNTITMNFDNEMSAISDAEREENMADSNAYNLAGQRVEKPVKGLYIVNGKKVVVK